MLPTQIRSPGQIRSMPSSCAVVAPSTATGSLAVAGLGERPCATEGPATAGGARVAAAPLRALGSLGGGGGGVWRGARGGGGGRAGEGAGGGAGRGGVVVMTVLPARCAARRQPRPRPRGRRPGCRR